MSGSYLTPRLPTQFTALFLFFPFLSFTTESALNFVPAPRSLRLFNICSFCLAPTPPFFFSFVTFGRCVLVCAVEQLLPPRPINRSLNNVALVPCVVLAKRERERRGPKPQQVAKAHGLRPMIICHSSRLSFCRASLALSDAAKPRCIDAVVETLHTTPACTFFHFHFAFARLG